MSIRDEIRSRLTKSPRRYEKVTVEGFDYWLQSLSELEASEASAAAVGKNGFDIARFKRELLIRAMVESEGGPRVFADNEQRVLLGEGTQRRITHALSDAVDRMNSGGDVPKGQSDSTETDA